MYSIGNTVSGTVTVLMVTESSHTCDEHSIPCRLFESLCHTPEINVTLQINYTSIKKRETEKEKPLVGSHLLMVKNINSVTQHSLP